MMGNEDRSSSTDRQGTEPVQKPSGAHPFQRLTPIKVRHLRSKPGYYADGNGLYLVVDASGAQRWVWRGVIRALHKRCELGLGSVKRITLADARQDAIKLKNSAREGGNPLQDRRAARRTVPTFRAVALEVHQEHSKGFSDKHRDDWISSLEMHAFPIIGDRPINVISSDEILTVLTPIWTAKPETARRVKQRIRLVMDWAKAKKHRSGDNPIEGLKRVLPKHSDQQQHFAALPYIQVPAFVKSLQTATNLASSIKLAFELMILTATRTNEVVFAKWDEINLDERIWIIPADRMKAKREHRIPLAQRAVEILTIARQQGLPNHPYVFAGRKPNEPLSNMAFLMALRRLAYKAITAHGFRSSFRDWCEERTNSPRAVSEAALAHTIPDKTEAAYRRTDLFERRRALMDLWAQFVTGTPGTLLAHSA